MLHALARHRGGDWGEVGPEDAAEMTQTYDVLLASGRTVFDVPVGLAHARDGGEIAVSLDVVPLGPHFSIVLRPHPTPTAD